MREQDDEGEKCARCSRCSTAKAKAPLPERTTNVAARVALSCLESFLAARPQPEPRPLSIWLAVDCGYGREGVEHSSPAAVDLAAAVHASPHARLAGLYSHSGDSYNCGHSGAAAVGSQELARMRALAAAVAANGVPVPALSLGATPSALCGAPWAAAAAAAPPLPRLELHPGNYAFFDRQQVASGSCSFDDVAVYVLARVCGVYRERNAVLIDAGACALHKDAGGLSTWGCLREDANMVLVKMTQEVSVLTTADGSAVDFEKFRLGSAVRVLPNHSCMTAAMFEQFSITKAGSVKGCREVVDVWKPCKWW